MSPIQVGAIMGDHAIHRGEVGAAFRRVASALKTDSIDHGFIEVVFDFPGSITRPAELGIRVGRVRRTDELVQVWVGVEDSIHDLAHPDERLFDLAADAIGAGAQALVRAKIAIEPEQVETAIKQARDALGFAVHGGSNAAILPEESRDGWVAEIAIPLPASNPAGAVQAVQLIEDELDRQLRDAGIGYVDGNEVDQVEYVIFAHTRTRDPDGLDRVVADVVPGNVRISWS